MTKYKPTISSREDLLAEKARLINFVRIKKTEIGNSFDALRDEVNPFKNFGKTAKDILTADFKNPIIGLGVGQITNRLVKNVLLKRAGVIPRLIIPIVLKKLSTYAISEKGGNKIANSLHTLAAKIRKS